MANTINADNGVSSGSAGLKETADSSGILALQTNGTTAVTVDTSQNVGIGVTPVASKGTLQVGTIGYTDTGVIAGLASSVAGYNQVILQNTSNNSGASTNFNVSNDAGTASTNYGELGINSSTFSGTGSFSQAGNVYLASASTDLVVGTYAAKPIRFVVNSGTTDAASIDSSGNILINTTSVIQSGKLSVAGVITSQFNGAGYSANQTNATGDQFYFRTNSGANLAGYITCPTSTTTSYTSVSDYRLKENIVPMTGALEKISLLKPCTYKWKADGVDGQGFIAHELQAVVPDCVVGNKDDVNEDGSIKPQAIDTSFLVATLTAAIQELTARITALESK